jgi:Tol biopolymer transport system component
MNADGSNQTQITKKEGGFPLFASPDGKWLYYLSGQQRTLWRVLTNGGEEQLVFNKRNHHFALSPDGSWIAFSEKLGEENILTIVSLADWQTVKTFKLADGKARLVELEWSRDGKFLAYILVEGESKNNILWFQPLDAETPRQIADLGDEGLFEISGLALAPDGKSFAVVQGSWRHDAVLLKGLK